MRAEIFWINNSLAVMPRPRGNDWLEDEIISYKHFGVDVIVSLLENHETIELELESEQIFCEKHEIKFFSFPIADRDTPLYFENTHEFVKMLNDFIFDGKRIAIHCRQGIGRASLIASCVLVLQNMSAEDAFRQIEVSRTCKVPDTPEQIDWVKEFANKLL
jgi:protein-tyrosine phosphatase